MGKYIVSILLVIFLIYMIVWTFRLQIHTKRKNKLNRIRELRAKKESKGKKDKEEPEKEEGIPQKEVEKTEPVKETKQESHVEQKDGEYWINVQELKQCTSEREKEKCYHYFSSVEEGVHGLLMEMYDYGLVRMDELETIAYGKSSFEDVDLSFLYGVEEVKQPETDDVMDAAKKLNQQDPGITDIKGTLSDGVEKVIRAVDKEKEIEAKKSEPISVKSEKSVEKARHDRAKTSNQEIRNKIFLKWDHYVDELYEMVEIKAGDDKKHKIKKALRDYGYNDVDVLLKSPE